MGGRSHRPAPILFGSPDWRQTGFLNSASDSHDHQLVGQVWYLPVPRPTHVLFLGGARRFWTNVKCRKRRRTGTTEGTEKCGREKRNDERGAEQRIVDHWSPCSDSVSFRDFRGSHLAFPGFVSSHHGAILLSLWLRLNVVKPRWESTGRTGYKPAPQPPVGRDSSRSIHISTPKVTNNGAVRRNAMGSATGL